MNKRGATNLMVGLIIAILITAAFFTWGAGLLPFLSTTIATMMGRANFFTFTSNLPDACSPEGTVSIPGLKISPNWHIFQFADFAPDQDNFTALSGAGSHEALRNFTAMENKCNGVTCLCLVYVTTCQDIDCEYDLGGECKNTCNPKERTTTTHCHRESVVCVEGTEVEAAEVEVPHAQCDSGVCCMEQGTTLYHYVFNDGSILYANTHWGSVLHSGSQSKALADYVYTNDEEKTSAINDMHSGDAIVFRSDANSKRKNIEDFTKDFLSSFYCKDQYDVVECFTFNGLGGECDEDAVLTDKAGKAVLAMPYSRRTYDRVTFIRSGNEIRINNVEVFTGT